MINNTTNNKLIGSKTSVLQNNKNKTNPSQPHGGNASALQKQNKKTKALLFPAKQLGCYGDGGDVFTNDDALADKMRSLKVHGQSKRYHHQYIGIGGRLDTIQAAVLNVKLKHYKKDLALRQEVAKKYTKALGSDALASQKEPSTFILLPSTSKDTTSAWAQYSIRVQPTTKNQKPETRNQLQSKLKENGIPTAVHYPKPLHLQECFEYLGYNVIYVQNITDVEDKVFKRASKMNIPPLKLTEQVMNEALSEMDYLNIKRPTMLEKVSSNIPAIIDMIKG